MTESEAGGFGAGSETLVDSGLEELTSEGEEETAWVGGAGCEGLLSAEAEAICGLEAGAFSV